ncbi:hypothetical protein J4210_05565 [Candidatus Woesearchaeota archaeon]|nr:hypothetical protein [Candidatus Woesearchaeota archaeon]
MNTKVGIQIAILMAVAVLFLPVVGAEVAVTSFTVEPQTVLPGEELTLRLTLDNSADETAENILVSLDLTNVPFAPVSTSNTMVIDKIDDHDHEMVSLFVRALPTATPGIYKIPVIVSQNNISKTSMISIEVKAKAALDLILGESKVTMVGTSGPVVLKFVNNGLMQIKFLKVTMQESPYYEVISPQSLYIGDVDVGDFETEEFTILPKGTDPILALTVEYRDTDNNVISQPKLLKLKVYTPEEAKLRGLVPEKSSTLSIILIVVLIIVIFFWYQRKRKRKHAA